MTARKPYQLVSREWKSQKTTFEINGVEIGKDLLMIAGPCALENEEQIYTISEFLSKKGVRFMRGGAYKPRTSPYSFQGLKKEGLELMRRAADDHGLAVVSEIMSASQLDEFLENVDILQVGTRNMQNYPLLRALGKINKPVLLKRGMSSTIEEWLLAAEYILSGGNEQVILCERGIRTFETATRNTLDIAAVPLVQQLSHLPVIVDPSQGTGVRDIVDPVSVAAIAAGADGLIIEVHNQPEEALSDGDQSIYLDQFETLQKRLVKAASIDNRRFDFQGPAVNIPS
ncbi:3-deoxy-7-phosphoheptulonate synthase [Bacteroidia bacterium]|nr:3-deoxy-7-phosphoheptulonate synthase [Bacteroidia bacterium]MDA9213581.1 3-deoxy-7-phosphoheptulonate synthase [Bacteroidia bacterium]